MILFSIFGCFYAGTVSQHGAFAVASHGGVLRLAAAAAAAAAANTNKHDAKHAMEIWTMERPIHLGASKALQNVSSSLSAVVENGMVTDQDASFC